MLFVLYDTKIYYYKLLKIINFLQIHRYLIIKIKSQH